MRRELDGGAAVHVTDECIARLMLDEYSHVGREFDASAKAGAALRQVLAIGRKANGEKALLDQAREIIDEPAFDWQAEWPPAEPQKLLTYDGGTA